MVAAGRSWGGALVFCALGLFPPMLAAQETLTLEEFSAYPAKAQLLILGTFHFKDAGLDAYKPEVDVDIQSASRQAELADVLDRLEQRFEPTRIALEARGDWAQRLAEEEYPAWLHGEFELKANEVYQVGFRLGRRLGLEELHYVDVLGRNYEDLPEDFEAYARSRGQSHLLESPWDDRYTRLYRGDDRAKARRTLRETFLAMNDPDRLLAGHGHYLLESLALGDDDSYPMADSVSGWWYNRNLRIFANLLRLAEEGDRILLVIGAGHVPIIAHAAEASPVFEVVTVAEVLGP